MDLFTNPGEMLDGIVTAPPRLANWLVPTLLACLASVVLLGPATNAEPTAAPIAEIIDAGDLSSADGEALAASWQPISAAGTCVSILAGTVWSAFVLWFIGRVFLRTRFAYLKAVELVGLTQMILVLGAGVTGLLILATGNPEARPALSLLALKLPPVHALRAFMDTLNFFHVWSTTILAMALARVSAVSFKEAAFWVFGYWYGLRVLLILLTL